MSVKKLCKRIVENPTGPFPSKDEIIPFLKEVADTLQKESKVIHRSGCGLFIGDIHGDLPSAIKALEIARQKNAIPIFMGDYVDRGEYQIESINYLLARKILDPDSLVLLRGNHEFKEVYVKFGFADEVMGKYPETVYWLYNIAFTYLPLAAVLNKKVLALHGGMASDFYYVTDIERLPTSDIGGYDERLTFLWNDPSEEANGFQENRTRRVFYTFGRDVFDKFMDNNNLELLVRGHEEVEEGARFFFDKRLISVFSSKGNVRKVEPKVLFVDEAGNVEVLGL